MDSRDEIISEVFRLVNRIDALDLSNPEVKNIDELLSILFENDDVAPDRWFQ